VAYLIETVCQIPEIIERKWRLEFHSPQLERIYNEECYGNLDEARKKALEYLNNGMEIRWKDNILYLPASQILCSLITPLEKGKQINSLVEKGGV